MYHTGVTAARTEKIQTSRQDPPDWQCFLAKLLRWEMPSPHPHTKTPHPQIKGIEVQGYKKEREEEEKEGEEEEGKRGKRGRRGRRGGRGGEGGGGGVVSKFTWSLESFSYNFFILCLQKKQTKQMNRITP